MDDDSLSPSKRKKTRLQRCLFSSFSKIIISILGFLLLAYGILWLVLHCTREGEETFRALDGINGVNLRREDDEEELSDRSFLAGDEEDPTTSNNWRTSTEPRGPLAALPKKTVLMVRTHDPTPAMVDRIACWAAQARRAGYGFLVSADETCQITKNDRKTRRRLLQRFSAVPPVDTTAGTSTARAYSVLVNTKCTTNINFFTSHFFCSHKSDL